MKKIILILITLFTISCSKDDNKEQEIQSEIATIEIPTSTVNYNSMDNWAFHPNKATILPDYNLDIDVINENLQLEQTISIPNNSNINTGIDVFWVHPTQITDNSFIGNVEIEDQPSAIISLTILAQGGLLSKYGRMYAPRYRQSTGRAYLDEDIDKQVQANVIATSYSDVKSAFLNYLNNHNNGNKIILAGHSQGSYLLALLLRDLFDNDSSLRSKLVTASLGGIGYLYAEQGQYKGGWWENIPLCTTTYECGCINNWVSFDEEQAIVEINQNAPQFNPYLINSGLVFRAFNENQDWFIQDFSYYGVTSIPLENYIVPNANYNLGNNTNFIAFDGLYNARLRREGLQKVVLSIEHTPTINDQRPNDLESVQNGSNYADFGYHTKDYNIYLWALTQQIDEKINYCE